MARAQNDRLKEALVQLRDLSDSTKAELQANIRDAETEKHDAVSAAVAELVAERDSLKDDVAELSEGLDAALESEDTVEELQNRVIVLQETQENLEEQVEELEELRDLNEELEEDHNAVETSLQKDVDQKEIAIQRLNLKIDELNDRHRDDSQVIAQFRSTGASKERQLTEMQLKEDQRLAQRERMGDTTQNLMSENQSL